MKEEYIAFFQAQHEADKKERKREEEAEAARLQRLQAIHNGIKNRLDSLVYPAIEAFTKVMNELYVVVTPAAEPRWSEDQTMVELGIEVKYRYHDSRATLFFITLEGGNLFIQQENYTDPPTPAPKYENGRFQGRMNLIVDQLSIEDLVNLLGAACMEWTKAAIKAEMWRRN